jgi:hypothetical protein
VTLIGDALRIARLPLHKNQRRSLKTRVVDLIVDLGHCDTNKRCTMFDACILFNAHHPVCGLNPGASQD